MPFGPKPGTRAILRSLTATLLILFGLSGLALSQQSPAKPTAPLAEFLDVAEKSGITMSNIFGGRDTKKYIIETTGTGVAIFDYDNDGWPDIFLVNGTTLEGRPQDKAATNHLYRNNHDGTFTDVTTPAGLAGPSGWGQGVCVGDYDNDGWEDIYVTYYGKNRLYHNNKGVFTEVAEKSGTAGTGKAWGTGCAFIDYDRDGLLDLVVANYVDFDLATAPAPGARASCVWKGVPVMCGPRGLPPAKNILYHNLGGRKIRRRHRQSAHRSNARPLFARRRHLRFRQRRLARHLHCLRQHREHPLPQQPRRNFHRHRRDRGSRLQRRRSRAGRHGRHDRRLQRRRLASTSSKPISPTTPPPSTATTGTAPSTTSTFAAGLGLHTQYLGWGAAFFDFDNDGWPDILVVNGHVYPEVDRQHLGSTYPEPRILYHNNGNGTFTDISADAGSGITTMHAGRGLAIGDLWNDGRLSAVISNMNDHASLLVNQVRSPNHWIAIRTVGTKSNRDGIGARVSVKAGSRVMVDEVRSGASYASNSDMRVHFGLSAANEGRLGSGALAEWPARAVRKLTNRFDSHN